MLNMRSRRARKCLLWDVVAVVLFSIMIIKDAKEKTRHLIGGGASLMYIWSTREAAYALKAFGSPIHNLCLC